MSHDERWTQRGRLQCVPPAEYCDDCLDWHPPGLHVCTCESGEECFVHGEER